MPTNHHDNVKSEEQLHILTCSTKSNRTAVAAHMLKFRTAGIGVRLPSPKAKTSQDAARVIEGPAEPRARPARVTRGNLGSCILEQRDQQQQQQQQTVMLQLQANYNDCDEFCGVEPSEVMLDALTGRGWALSAVYL